MSLTVNRAHSLGGLLLGLLLATGCQSGRYADRGTLFGGLAGAGVGAIVGDAMGDAGAGAAIGAGVGAMTGSVIGESLDEIDARNRAQIAAQMGQAVHPGAATFEDVIAMSEAGVAEQLIVSHVRNNGIAAPLSATDVILLHKQGVSTRVIEAMQAPPIPPMLPTPQQVIVEEHHYDCGPPPIFDLSHRPRRHPSHGSRVGWGISLSN